MSMINGHDPLQAAIEQAQQQQAQEQMLRHALNQALNQPARVTQITGPCLVQVVDNPAGGQVLLIAQITGDRWDIPIDPATAKRIAYAFAKAQSDHEGDASAEGLEK